MKDFYKELAKDQLIPDFENFDYEKVKDRWPVILRLNNTGTVNIGYKLNQENYYELLPDWDVIPYLEKAFDLNQSDYGLRDINRRLTEIFTEKGWKTFSHTSLSNLYRRHRLVFLTEEEQLKQNKKRKPRPFKKLSLKKSQAIRSKHKAERELVEITKKQAELKVKRELQKDPKRQKINLSLYNDNGDALSEKDLIDLEIEKMKQERNLNVVFRPNPGPQEDFLAASEQEVLYGGSAGGEPKSWFYRLLLQ
jgi:hypothetical protein